MFRFAAIALFALLQIAPVALAGAVPPAATPTGVRPPDRHVENVVIGSGRQRLAGSLHRPTDGAPGPAPAVVVVSGSGPNDRDGRIGAFRAYGLIAEHLARSGVATLLIDRRGVGGSAGDWRRETIHDRARDVVAAVRWLRGQPGIDAARVGVLGHSQGGWVAEQAAADSSGIAFVVLMAGPGETVRAQILTDEENELHASGIAPDEVERRVRRLARVVAIADAIAPACRLLRLHPVCSTVDYDPAGALARIRVPVLALFARLDPMVPPEPNASLIRAGLARAGNDRLTVQVFERANHQFWPAITGARSEYRSLEKRYVPGFLDAIGSWILTGRSPPSGADASATVPRRDVR